MTVTTIGIEDMHCASCEQVVAGALAGLGTIRELRFNPVRRQVVVTHDRDLGPAALLREIEDAGFRPVLLGPLDGQRWSIACQYSCVGSVFWRPSLWWAGTCMTAGTSCRRLAALRRTWPQQPPGRSKRN